MSDATQNEVSIRRRRTINGVFRFLSIIIALLIFVTAFYVDRVVTDRHISQQRKTYSDKISVLRYKLERNITGNAQLAQGLVAAIATEPDMTAERFRNLAEQLLANKTQIRNIAGAPDLVIKMMYPLAGNEKAIGLNYKENKTQAAAALKAKELGAFILAGPVNLVQGGVGFIGRLPVFIDRDDGDEKQFWGLVSAVVDADTLYQESGLMDHNLPLDIALRGTDASGSRGGIFWGPETAFENDPIVQTVNLPWGNWVLAASPKDGWQISPWKNWYIFAIAAISGFLIIFSISLANRMFEVEMKTIELRSEKKIAEDSSRAKSDFLASMSHEIRTPMNGVLGMAELLSLEPLSPKQSSMLRTIQNSSESLLRIIDDILDISKIEAGKIDLENESVSVRELVEEVMSTSRVIAREHKVELAMNLNQRVQFIQGDSVRLRQILMNLLGNAIKFSDSDKTGRQGKVELSVEQDDDGILRFSIKDNGIGISHDQVESLFQPFQQADNRTMRVFGGTGLGLTIVKTLVDMMDGSINVSTNLGEGSIFSVRIPFTECTGDVVDPDLSGVSVFAISHKRGVREKLKTYVENCGAEIEFSNNEDNFVATINSQPDSCVGIVALDAQEHENEIQRISNVISPMARCIVLKRNFHDTLLGEQNFRISVQESPIIPSELTRAIAELGTKQGDIPKMPEDRKRDENRFPVLLVEDNIVNQQVLSTQLKLLGYEVEVTTDGMSGLDMWKSGGFEFILTDCHMPKMDGFEMTRNIRSIEKGEDSTRTTIIAITANALKGEADKCMRAGMDDYLSKPVALENLKATMQKWARETPTENRP